MTFTRIKLASFRKRYWYIIMVTHFSGFSPPTFTKSCKEILTHTRNIRGLAWARMADVLVGWSSLYFDLGWNPSGFFGVCWQVSSIYTRLLPLYRSVVLQFEWDLGKWQKTGACANVSRFVDILWLVLLCLLLRMMGKWWHVTTAKTTSIQPVGTSERIVFPRLIYIICTHIAYCCRTSLSLCTPVSLSC